MVDPPAYARLDGGAAAADVVDLSSLSRLGDRLLDMGTAVVAIKLGDQGLYVRTSGVAARVRDFCDRLALNADAGATARSCRRASARGASSGRPVRATARSPASSRRCCAAKGRWRPRPARRRSARRASRRADATGGVPPWPELAARLRAGWDRHPIAIRVDDRRLERDALAPSRSVDPTRNPHEIARRKLANIHADPHGAKDFILADAKDADMAAGLAAPGKDAGHGQDRARWPSIATRCARSSRQGLVDIMLMSASTSEVLTIQRAAVRRLARHARRPRQRHDRHPPASPAAPTRRSRRGRSASATIDQIQCGKVDPDARRAAAAARTSASTRSRRTTTSTFDYVDARRRTRNSASRPSARASATSSKSSTPTPAAAAVPDGPRAVHQRPDRPHARRRAAARAGRSSSRSSTTARRRWRSWSPTTRTSCPGILGGSSGTTYDAFKLLEEAKKYGARAALFGRKINNSEHQLTFVRFLRAIADGQIGAEEACRAYHGDLAKLGIKPYRPLDDDLELTGTSAAYAGGG